MPKLDYLQGYTDYKTTHNHRMHCLNSLAEKMEANFSPEPHLSISSHLACSGFCKVFKGIMVILDHELRAIMSLRRTLTGFNGRIYGTANYTIQTDWE